MSYVGFKALNEDWSEYKLKDGSILKARYILVKILAGNKRDEMGNPIYESVFTNAVGVFSPDSLRGERNVERYTPEELSKSIVDEDIDFEKTKEGWSTYQLEDESRISAKLELMAISRTSKLDPMGDPIYMFNLQPLVKVRKAVDAR